MKIVLTAPVKLLSFVKNFSILSNYSRVLIGNEGISLGRFITLSPGTTKRHRTSWFIMDTSSLLLILLISFSHSVMVVFNAVSSGRNRNCKEIRKNRI